MKIDGLLPQQILHILNKANLEALKAGDIVQGRVVSVESGLLFMKLLDGSVFSAKVPEGFTAQQGTMLALQIGEKVGDQLTAKILQPDAQTGKQAAPPDQSLQSVISAKLESLGAKPTEALVAKVVDLMEHSASLGMDKAAFLAANGIKPDQEMVSLMMRLANKEFQIDQNLNLLRNNLFQAVTSGNQNPELEKTFIKPLLADQELESMASNLAGKLLGGEGLQGRSNNAVDQQIRMQLTKNILDEISQQFSKGEPVTRETLNTILQKAIDDLTGQKGQVINTPQQSSDVPKLEVLGEKTLAEWTTTLQKGFEALREKISDAAKLDGESIRQILHKTFEKAFIKVDHGTTEPAELSEKVKVIKDILTMVSEATTHMDPKTAEASMPVIRELQNALQFFHQVSAYQTFVQIPLVLNKQDTTGELYVMRGKKKKGKIDPNQFTLFISLHTQNLGLVETFLNATNRYVTVHFRVGSEELVKMVKDHHRVLYDALAEKGYKLAEMRCRLHEDEPVNLFNAMEKTEDALGIKASLDLKI